MLIAQMQKQKSLWIQLMNNLGGASRECTPAFEGPASQPGVISMKAFFRGRNASGLRRKNRGIPMMTRGGNFPSVHPALNAPRIAVRNFLPVTFRPSPLEQPVTSETDQSA
jgi:hypothetical protein